MTQPSLFDQEMPAVREVRAVPEILPLPEFAGPRTDEHPPFATASRTSEAAADSMKKHAPQLRELVFDYIARQGPAGATSDEIEVRMDLRHQTASARVNELMNLKRIKTAGRRETRSGRMANVWVVA